MTERTKPTVESPVHHTPGGAAYRYNVESVAAHIQKLLDFASSAVRDAASFAGMFDSRRSMPFRAKSAKTQSMLTELGEERRIMFGESPVSKESRARAEDAIRRNAETDATAEQPVACARCGAVVRTVDEASQRCPQAITGMSSHSFGRDDIARLEKTSLRRRVMDEHARHGRAPSQLDNAMRKAGLSAEPARKRAPKPKTDPAARTSHEREAEKSMLPEQTPARVSIKDELGDEFHRRKTTRKTPR